MRWAVVDLRSAVHDDVDEIRRILAGLERRLAALEHTDRALARDDELPGRRPEPPPRGGSGGAALVLAGRAFLAFGGAFVLRALTESRTVGPRTGVWLGLTYAAAWLAAVERSTGASRTLNAWLGLAIALPLVVEAAARFGLLSTAAALAALVLIAGVALPLAWHRRLPSLAAGTAVGIALVSIVVGIAQGHLVPFAALTLVAGIATLWIAYHRDWRWLEWPTAGAVNMVVLVMALRACVRPPLDPPAFVLLTLAAFGVAYLASFFLRTLLHERAVLPFEMAQTCIVGVVGLGGAVLVARINSVDVTAVGLPAIVVATALYAQTFVRVGARRGYGADFHYYAFTAFVLIVAGLALVLPPAARPLVLAAGAVVVAVTGWKLALPSLGLQAAVGSVIALASAGFFGLVVAAWTAPAVAWPPGNAAMAIALGTAALGYALSRRDHVAASVFSLIARLLTAACLATSFASALLMLAAKATAASSAGELATWRTVALASTAVVLARLGRDARELRWLAYGGLAIDGAKILFEDAARSRAATLFVALAAYGLALIATPRMTRKPGD